MSSQDQEKVAKIAKLFGEASELFTSVRCQDATVMLHEIMVKSQTTSTDILSQHRLNADLSSKLGAKAEKLKSTETKLEQALKDKRESSAQAQEAQKELRKIKEMMASREKEFEKERNRVENQLATARAELEWLRSFSITLTPLSVRREEIKRRLNNMFSSARSLAQEYFDVSLPAKITMDPALWRELTNHDAVKHAIPLPPRISTRFWIDFLKTAKGRSENLICDLCSWLRANGFRD
ncbi:hypothetical protein MMYC01_202293 [Madurella mycetomatis]|uniref:Kinetochore protein SPC25 n=1 Tax=Madurella mycetomatis TaxID=100816 RepID=A0A175W9H1_9PEZI|nr:hypothetical protein MMYC01_202293 [Madurella mycetomatis]